jgi:hypothetical protein
MQLERMVSYTIFEWNMRDHHSLGSHVVKKKMNPAEHFMDQSVILNLKQKGWQSK